MAVQSTELPTAYRVNAVGLIMTLRCNAECGHCCFECHPKRSEQMSRAQVLDYISQIAAFDDIRVITITGGEPFTAYPLLRTAIEAAGRHGLMSRIVSNGGWATSPKRARDKLAPLVDAGLHTLNISHDEAHAPYIKDKWVKQAVESALELGLEVAISHASLQGAQPGDAERIMQNLGLGSDDPVLLMQGHISPGGRARMSYPLERMSLVDGHSEEGQRLRNGCIYVLREPVIMPNGDFAACCGTTVADYDSFREEFVVGNLNERPLAEWVEELEYSPLFNKLMLDGPWALYEALNAIEPRLLERKTFVNICDLCEHIVCNPQAMAVLQGQLQEEELPLMVKKMMLNVAREEKLAAEG